MQKDGQKVLSPGLQQASIQLDVHVLAAPENFADLGEVL